MATIFITYGDDRFRLSLERITRQARESGRFDKVIKYTPKDLPVFVRSSPLFLETKGGGCWCWKPYIIHHTLNNCNIGDIVYYADAGCSLIASSPEWTVFENLLQIHSAIYFQYRRDYSYPGWENYCKQDLEDKTAIKHWMKPALIEYFKEYDDPGMFEFDSLWAGFIIVKKTTASSVIINQWLKITFFHPELVLPPFGAELSNLPESYCDHRCNQGILTPLVYHYKDADNALIVPETSESAIGNPAIMATRWRQAKLSPILYLKYRLHSFLHHH